MMSGSLMSSTIATSLTLQKVSTIIHALDGFKGGHSDVPGLLKRLQCAIDEGIAGLEFSGEEIYDIINALSEAIEKTLEAPDRRYGFFSADELRRLLEDFEEFLRR